MSDYLSNLPFSQPIDLDGVRRLALNACLALHRVDWRRSYASADGTRLLCWYCAQDAESVRLVLRQLGSASTAVWPVATSDDASVAPADGAVQRVVAELAFDAPADAARLEAAKESVAVALRSAGYSLVRVFAAPASGRLVFVIDGSDQTSVSACLQAAGYSPVAVWRSVELDPRPPPLFGSTAPIDAPRATVARVSAASAAADVLDAVIIGAGLGGICALERLVRMGRRVQLYEAARDVGGVWHWNRYPGARVDSETYTYGYSFSDALVRDWDWRELFSPQSEIERYLRHVVERFDLRRHMRLATRVVAASYDAAQAVWQIDTDRGEHVRARYLIAATGSLSTPQLPDYPGVDEFAGASYHTSQWPAEPVDLAGRRIGVIGTGATGVQVIQTIAAEVGQLTVFQRSPTYCLPQRNRPLSDEERGAIRRDWAGILTTCRSSYGGFIHDFEVRSGLAISDAEREAKFEALWQTPGLAFWLGNFGDLVMNEEVNFHASEFLRRKIRARVSDPQVARKLLPDHPFGAKRVPLENGYYEAFNRDNVRLVDLRETPILAITKRGIRTSAEEIPLDVIVYATGFDAGTGALTRIDLRGDAGVSLAEKWRVGPTTYLGLLVHGFPNFFMVNGPHNAAALCNAGRCIEQNVEWIARCLEHLRAQGCTHVVPTEAAEREWTRHVEDVAEATLLSKAKNSWFFGANTPGKARRVNIYAGGARAHKEQCEAVARAGYPGLTMW